MLLAALNSGTLIIALPVLKRSLHTSLLTLVWVILVYMIASTVLVLSAGRLSDQFGRENAYMGGFVVFAAASLGAGFSGSGTELIIWRIAQGLGGSFLFANSAAIVTDAFPREQLGLAMGTNTMVAAIGLVIGPVLGGALVDISWHWVFWFNVPFGLIGSAWAFSVLREMNSRSTETAFDALGTGTFVIGLTGLVLGISKGGIEGWNSPMVYSGLIAAVIFLPLFVFVESRHKQPMLDLTIFKDRLFAAAAGASFMNGLARFSLMFVFVFYFQGVQGDTPITAGLKLAPLAVGMLIASPLAGRYADRNGSRALAALGMLGMGVGMALMTTLQRHTSYFWPGLFQLITGIGSGAFQSPNTAAMMGVVAPPPSWHRLRRPHSDSEHRCGALDRFHNGDRDLVCAEDDTVQRLLRARCPYQRSPAGAVPEQHAYRTLVPRRRISCWCCRVTCATPRRCDACVGHRVRAEPAE